ncbi:MAG: enoyl-CoA hydratase/isomerase family protein [Actinomycetota bacterium]
MGYTSLEVTERGGAVWITLNRPDALNSINEDVVRELVEVLNSTLDQQPVAIVLTGKGRAFCTGADLKWAKEAFAQGVDTETRTWLIRLGEVMSRLERSPVPTIAAVNGICVAGGCELLCSVDLAVAAESAVIGDAHSNYGLLPGGGASIRLPLLVGIRNAKRLLFLGEMLSAAEVKEMGLVNWVVPDDQLEAKVDEIVASLAAKAPGGLGKMKYLANFAHRATPEVGIEMEQAIFFDHINSSDEIKEGLAAFKEKRAPNFRKR